MIEQAGIPARAGFPAEGAEVVFCCKWVDNSRPDNYWSGTEYAPNTSNAWNFNFDDGNQNNDNKGNNNYALAVHSGK
jgi:hypothetical protein